jgi:SAM-dependent methyltransferase
MNADLAITCPVCGGTVLECLGAAAYRQPHKVAGVAIDLSEIKPVLVRCKNCTYWFYTPRIPMDRLLECYSKSSADFWTTDTSIAAKRNYARKAELLRQYAPGNRILDYGCFDGGFLDFLGSSWFRFGIEPSAKAAAVAQQRGIQIIASSTENIPTGKLESFDAIVLFDVIEHVNEPVCLLTTLASLLQRGGILLIETGDTDSQPFQRNGRLYSYCTPIEHVGFMNRRSLGAAAEKSGFRLIAFERSRHMQRSAWGYLEGDLTNFIFKLLYHTKRAGLLLPGKLNRIANAGLPRPSRKPDHLLAVLERV